VIRDSTLAQKEKCVLARFWHGTARASSGLLCIPTHRKLRTLLLQVDWGGGSNLFKHRACDLCWWGREPRPKGGEFTSLGTLWGDWGATEGGWKSPCGSMNIAWRYHLTADSKRTQFPRCLLSADERGALDIGRPRLRRCELRPTRGPATKTGPAHVR